MTRIKTYYRSLHWKVLRCGGMGVELHNSKIIYCYLNKFFSSKNISYEEGFVNGNIEEK